MRHRRLKTRGTRRTRHQVPVMDPEESQRMELRELLWKDVPADLRFRSGVWRQAARFQLQQLGIPEEALDSFDDDTGISLVSCQRDMCQLAPALRDALTVRLENCYASEHFLRFTATQPSTRPRGAWLIDDGASRPWTAYSKEELQELVVAVAVARIRAFKLLCEKAKMNNEQSIWAPLDVLGDMLSESPVDHNQPAALPVATHAHAHMHSHVPSGLPELCALTLCVADGDAAHAFEVALCLSVIQSAMERDSSRVVRQHMLVIASWLAQHHAPLAQHLHNTIGVDVLECGNVALAWCLPLFTLQFACADLSLHAVDVTLCEGVAGPSLLFLGMLLTHERELCQLESRQQFYDFLDTVAEQFDFDQVESVLAVSRAHLHSDSGLSGEDGATTDGGLCLLERAARQKSWRGVVAVEGRVAFLPDIGDCAQVRTLVQEQLEVRRNDMRINVNELIKPERPHEDSSSNSRPKVRVKSATSHSYGHNREDREEDEDTDENKEDQLQQLSLSSASTTPSPRYSKTDSVASHFRLDAQEQEQQPVTVRLARDALKSKQSENPRRRLVTQIDVTSSPAVPVEMTSRRQPPRQSVTVKYSMFSQSWSTSIKQLRYPCVVMEGYLKRATSSLFKRTPTLSRAYFVLRGPFLTYMKNASSSKPGQDRCLDVRGANVRALDEHASATLGEFAFEIYFGDESEHGDASTGRKKQHRMQMMSMLSLVLFAESEEERETWVSVLKAAVRVGLGDFTPAATPL